MKVNPAYVMKQVRYIEKIKGDDEAAHAMEDTLHYEVLAAIANGECENIVVCASEAIKTADIQFARWCA